MPTEPTLRHLFDAPQPASTIDVRSVVRRSRARRLPKMLGAAGVGALAIGGLVIGGLQLGAGPQPASDAAGTSAEAPAMDAGSDELFSESIKRAPAEKINLCTGAVAEPTASVSGLVLSVSFADAAVGASTVSGTVTMTNAGSETVTGYTAASPAITLAQNGVVIWHSNGPMIEMAREVTLAPGESLDYTASFSPVICGVEDDLGESFRDGLPAAPAGDYQVSAAIDLLGDFNADLITGPSQTITLR